MWPHLAYSGNPLLSLFLSSFQAPLCIGVRTSTISASVPSLSYHLSSLLLKLFDSYFWKGWEEEQTGDLLFFSSSHFCVDWFFYCEQVLLFWEKGIKPLKSEMSLPFFKLILMVTFFIEPYLCFPTIFSWPPGELKASPFFPPPEYLIYLCPGIYSISPSILVVYLFPVITVSPHSQGHGCVSSNNIIFPSL